jgi:hypothetical protein
VLDVGGQPQAVGVAAAEPAQPGQVEDPTGQAQLQQRITASSSSLIGSSGPIRANPIDSRVLPS